MNYFRRDNIFKIKNGNIEFEDTEMDYISFGKGNEILVIIPGLGDGITTVKGKALPLAISFKEFNSDYRVYIFSRKNKLPTDYSTRDMARDQAMALRKLNIEKANIMGISQGGMIAQYLSIDYPGLVNKLVLVATLSRQNETVDKTINRWLELAKDKNYKDMIIDSVEKMYSDRYKKKYKLFYPFLGFIGKPKDFTRFIIQANSCINHNAYNELEKIISKTFIIGGAEDRVLSGDSSIEINEKINNSELFIYNDLGHGLYEEALDFNSKVLEFLNRK